jgi:hypothetical protein
MDRFSKSLVETPPVGAVSVGQRRGGLRNVHVEHNYMFSEFLECTLQHLLVYISGGFNES